MENITLDDVKQALAKHRETLEKLSVRELWLFGSVARGEGGEDSDLDFLVDFDHKTFGNFMDLRFFLEDLFQRRLDLVTRAALKPALREIVLQEAVRAA